MSGAGDGPPSSAAAAFSFAAQMTTAASTAVLTIFLVRTLEPAGYGLFGLSTSISVIVLVAADFGISSSTARIVAERRDRLDDVGRLYVDALKLKLAATGVVCLLLVVFAGVIADAYGEPDLAWPLRAIAIATFGQSVMLMGSAVFTALGRMAIRLRIIASEALLELAASVGLVLLGGGAAAAAFGRAAGYGIGALLAVTIGLRLVGRPPLRLLRPPSRETVRRVRRYAGSLAMVDSGHILSGNANVLFVGGYLGSAAAGVFHAPTRLLTLLQYPGLSVANAVSPRLARRPGHEPDVQALEAALRRLIAFQCVVLAPAVIWADPIVALVLGPGYEQASDVLTALAPHAFFLGLAPLLSTSANYLGAARRRIPIALLTLAIATIGAITLIPRHGLVGAAIATTVAYGFYTLAHLWLCRRLVRLPLGGLAWSLACGLTAAAAMGIVLSQVGTEDLTSRDWIVGWAGGLAAYVGMLVFTREISARDLARVGKRLRGTGRKPHPSRPEPVAPPASREPAALVDAGIATHEIRWRSTGDEGVFELRLIDGSPQGGDVPSEAASSPLAWGWHFPPAPTPEARQAHDRLMIRLLRRGWQPSSRGEPWFAQRFRRP